MTNQIPKPDPDESWESLAQDLFGIEFTPTDSDEDPLSIEELDLELSIDDDADDVDSDAGSPPAHASESPLATASSEIGDESLDESAELADAEEFTSPEPEAQTPGVAEKLAESTEPKDAKYWDPLLNWEWEESRHDSEGSSRDSACGRSGSRTRPVETDERRSRPRSSSSSARSAQSSKSGSVSRPPRAKSRQDDDFGMGIWEEEKPAARGRDDQEPRSQNVTRSDSVDAVDVDDDDELNPSIASEAVAEEKEQKPERRRRRRRRRKPSSSREPDSAVESVSGEIDEDGDSELLDGVESLEDESIDEAVQSSSPSEADEGDAGEKPRGSRRRRRSRRRRGDSRRTEGEAASSTSAAEESEMAIETDEEADDVEIIPESELDEVGLDDADAEDRDEDDEEFAPRVYRNVPSWEQAISYIMHPRRAARVEGEHKSEAVETTTKDGKKSGKPRRRRRRKGPRTGG